MRNMFMLCCFTPNPGRFPEMCLKGSGVRPVSWACQSREPRRLLVPGPSAWQGDASAS